MKSSFEVSKINSIVVVTLPEQLVLENASELKEVLNNIIETDGYKHIILNAEKLNLLDSIGIGVIIASGYKPLKDNDGKLVVCNMDGNINRLFEVSGLIKFIPAYDSIEDAISKM